MCLFDILYGGAHSPRGKNASKGNKAGELTAYQLEESIKRNIGAVINKYF